MSEAVETIETDDGYTVSVYVDTDPESPREWENVGTFLGLPHRHYRIGDETIDPSDYDAGSMSELAREVAKAYDARVILPVGMLDHSGVTYYVGGGAHWTDPGGWDSGTCGFILATRAAVAEAWMGTDPGDDVIRRALTSEVKAYAAWAEGSVYGFDVTTPEGDNLPGSWGFYGYDNEASGLLDAARDVIADHREEFPALFDIKA